MESNNLITVVAIFIGIAIMLGVGIQILGSVQVGINCASLPGNAGTKQTASNATGWALSCLNSQTSTQSAYTLLVVILIVIAAVAILLVVRML